MIHSATCDNKQGRRRPQLLTLDISLDVSESLRMHLRALMISKHSGSMPPFPHAVWAVGPSLYQLVGMPPITTLMLPTSELY